MTRFLLCAFVAALSGSAGAQTPITTGPATGARVPDFEAPDQNGTPHSLHSIMGPKGAMLVFFRSADW